MSTTEKIIWISVAGAGITAAAFYVMYKRNSMVENVSVTSRPRIDAVILDAIKTNPNINQWDADALSKLGLKLKK
jgi:hypothetical protein